LKDLSPESVAQINEASRKYYDQPGQTEYWRNKPFSDPKWAPWFLSRFGLLLSACRLRPFDRVLDFGCGTGWTSIMMAQMGAEVFGLDVAKTALSIARENAKRLLTEDQFARIHFEEFDGHRISAENGYFDFVVVFEAMHHLPNPETVLREFSRVLHQHGLFAFAEPGLGHAGAHCSEEEAAHGILEEDLDLERFYRTGTSCGFQDLDLMVAALSPDILTLPMKRARQFLRGCSWLLPADFFRSSILSAPIGIFRKGPYSNTSLHPKEHRGRIVAAQPSISVQAAKEFAMEVVVENPTDTVWLKKGIRGRGYVRLGAQLLKMGAVLQRDYARADLPLDLAQDQRAKVLLHLRAPSDPGEYVLRLDLVNEGICWFSEEGSDAIDIPFTVAG
jgi:2-polyprenyl-3-methyl-5-hydroxy-6-metoxy-1,4-benzoquinol methylase